ncbi:TetR family transcriptional regulator [Microtetraspora sp. NBRC 16547]|uniref:acyl-CoA-like ligand-binding transcription factor n=1 Tax=Microtetraspora sp. NBRC 16547 TaxID=3030993 RepID=UPI0024A0D665|nr:TetR family transcriptional regulator [Microtetraspora sp. NBRC 16547]GLW98562.1 TetR family transcriptional regulator [Microtetraspora sp. NBRC 16547]
MGTEGERLGLRERKKQETRIALSWAAIRLAVERGLDNVRVEDIAAEAGVSPRTFNNYFSSKGEAIAARHLDRARLIADELRARPASEPLWEAIAHAVMARFTLRQGAEGQGAEGAGGQDTPDRQWLDGVRLMTTDPALTGAFLQAATAAETELAAAIAERTGADVDRDLYPRLVAGAVGVAIRVSMQQWLHADPPVPINQLLRDALRQLSMGLPVP